MIDVEHETQLTQKNKTTEPKMLNVNGIGFGDTEIHS